MTLKDLMQEAKELGDCFSTYDIPLDQDVHFELDRKQGQHIIKVIIERKKDMIEDYVSYETAKLLKERGFDGECRDYYSTDGHFYSEDFKSDWNHGGEAIVIFSAPTLQMAMKWLREVHNIFIQVELYSKYDNYCFELFQNTHRLIIEHREVYNSYEESCEAAIKYCLENLI